MKKKVKAYRKFQKKHIRAYLKGRKYFTYKGKKYKVELKKEMFYDE